MAVKAEECPLLFNWDWGWSTWFWSFHCSDSVLAEAYLEVEGGRYHSAAAWVIKTRGNLDGAREGVGAQDKAGKVGTGDLGNSHKKKWGQRNFEGEVR